MEKVRESFGWAATALTMCFYISPTIPFINVFKGRISYEDTPAIIITTSYINCFCWYIYGDMISSDQIKICNLIGAISSLILICIYLAFELKKYTIDAILNASIVCSGSFAAYRGFTILVEDDTLIGKVCICTSCIVFMSPIQIIYRVSKEKNYNLIPIYTSWVSIFSTSFWITYGVLTTDIYIIFPNLIGLILGIIQICIYLTYKRKYPGIGEREFTSTIGIETTGFEEDKKEENNQSNTNERPVRIIRKSDI